MLMQLLFIFLIVVVILFFLAPRWLGKTSSHVARRTKTTFRKNVREFNKGTSERDRDDRE